MTRATLLSEKRFVYEDGSFVRIKVWVVPSKVPPSRHDYKYSFVYIVSGKRVIGYDNERGKGDHRHYRGVEAPYIFHSIGSLLADFEADVEHERSESHGDQGRDETMGWSDVE